MRQWSTGRGLLTLATNNGDIAGGEVMLFAIAAAARELGCRVTVVGPSSPSEVLDHARSLGLATAEVTATGRMAYMRGLRTWDSRSRRGLLWCNGLVPAFATSGHANRIVHLHQLPQSPAQWGAAALARVGSSAVLVPSDTMTQRIRGSEAMSNWSPPVTPHSPGRPSETGRVRLGYLGRHSSGKGLVVLAEAVSRLDQERPGVFRLVLAGDPRSVPKDDQVQVSEALNSINHLIERRGWVAPEEFFSDIDLAVFPSVAPESFGLVVTEAQSARVPFVVSDAGALPEVAGPGYPWVARAGDASDLARVITRALDQADVKVVDSSYRRWEELYSPEAGKRRLADRLVRLGALGHLP